MFSVSYEISFYILMLNLYFKELRVTFYRLRKDFSFVCRT